MRVLQPEGSSRPFQLTTIPVRPVLTEGEAMAICRRVSDLAKGGLEHVTLEHKAMGVTRISRRKRRMSRDGDSLELKVQFDNGSKASVLLLANQVDDASLRAAVSYLERVTRDRMGPPRNLFKGLEYIGPRSYLPAQLWHDTTVKALVDERTEKVATVFDASRAAGLTSAIFIGTSAYAYCVMRRDGIAVYGQSTDAEVTVTSWTTDLKGSGWGGAAARDWSKLDPIGAAARAIDIAQRSRDPNALEPGRRTVILGPAAVAQLVAKMDKAFDAWKTHAQLTPFSKPPKASRVGERVFDPRISMRSDPNDPDGGYLPFFAAGFPQPAMSWVERGELKNLAYMPDYAASCGVDVIADIPRSIRVEGSGNLASVDDMIANCKTGVYVNRFAGVTRVDGKSGLLTGYTRDGCFLVKDGKIDRAIKNFRFLDSPFFSLNQLEMVGKSARAAMGYTPEEDLWPLSPIIVPPMMVRDFNFIALADAV